MMLMLEPNATSHYASYDVFDEDVVENIAAASSNAVSSRVTASSSATT